MGSLGAWRCGLYHFQLLSMSCFWFDRPTIQRKFKLTRVKRAQKRGSTEIDDLGFFTQWWTVGVYYNHAYFKWSLQLSLSLWLNFSTWEKDAMNRVQRFLGDQVNSLLPLFKCVRRVRKGISPGGMKLHRMCLIQLLSCRVRPYPKSTLADKITLYEICVT